MKLKIAIIGIVGLPPNYGGFETLTDNLVNYLNQDHDFTVYCSKKHYNHMPDLYNNVRLKYVNINANGFQSIFYDMFSIIDSYKKNDILLLLGVSGAMTLPFLRKKKLKVITNIDGLEWRRGKWGKIQKLLLKKLERVAVKYSTAVITDNYDIYDYVRNEYNRESLLIEYGGDHVKPQKFMKYELHSFDCNEYYFSVCRIEPENNISLILESFAETNKKLVIVGNWYNSEFGKDLYIKYKDHKNIFLFNKIYDIEELDRLRSNCICYIHGHSAGGTNPSLVEAMSLGLNVVAFDVQFNVYTTEGKAEYFTTKDDLEQLINCSISNGDEMLEIARRRYTWKAISTKYNEAFLRVIGE